jgi:hypothetical protein
MAAELGRWVFFVPPTARFYSETTETISVQLGIGWEGKGTGKVVPVLNKAPRHEDVLGGGGTEHALKVVVQIEFWSLSAESV